MIKNKAIVREGKTLEEFKNELNEFARTHYIVNNPYNDSHLYTDSSGQLIKVIYSYVDTEEEMNEHLSMFAKEFIRNNKKEKNDFTRAR
ncbi:hypothetical protein ACMZ62_07080 [Streptococcus pluranimalium]